MYLKLSNGSQINLNDLDKLENRSSDNALLKFFDKIGLGGNKNNIFDKNEIKKIKAFLMEMAGSDGVIDKNDIKNARLKYASIFDYENYNEQNMADDLSMLSLGSKKNNGSSPDYKVKSGDTVKKIVAELGYTGEDAKKYEAALEAQLEADGSFMNDKKWLLTGSKIRLLSDEKLKELGINKIQNPPASQKTGTNNNRAARSPQGSDASSPDYKVKSGDSIRKIVAELGYTGEDAKKYEAALEAQLEADGSFMNDKKWLMAGSKIKLLSDKKLKELGITKQTAPKIETPQTPQTPQTPGAPVEKRTRAASPGGTQKDPVNTDTSLSIVTNSAQRILNIMKESGHKGRIVYESEVSDEAKEYGKLYKQLYKTEPQYIKNDATGEIHVFFDTAQTEIGKKLGMQSCEQIFGEGIKKTNRYYTNGKIVQDVEKDNGQMYSTLIQAPPNKRPVPKKQILTPVPIEIQVDPSVYEGASESQRKQIDAFINTLKTQKASLMKDLNMDDDTYNRFAQMACAIAMQETEFGKGDRYRYLDGNSAGTVIKDTVAVFNIGLSRAGANVPTAVSKGLTQIKIGDWDDNPRIEKLFAKYGIKRGYYNKLNGEQSAAATMIVLNELSKQLKRKDVQNGIEAANDKYFKTDAMLVNGRPVSRPEGYLVRNHVTEDDALMYLYNGASGRLKRGNATPATRVYTHNIRRYRKLFTITEDPAQRAEALRNAPTIVESQEKRKPMSKDLSWGIGQVSFMPKVYAGGVAANSASEIEKLKETLMSKGFDVKDVNRLITKMQNGELAFVNGLSSTECAAMTQEDLKLMLEYSDRLKTALQSAGTAQKKRQIATAMDKEFKREYLASHARQVYMSEAGDSAIVLNESRTQVKPYPKNGYQTGAQKRCNTYLTQLRGDHRPDSGIYMYQNRVNKGFYTGFNVERDRGINYDNASDMDILLAQNGADSANTLRTSGACLTGTKQALIGSGCVTPEEMSTFNNAFQLAKFLERHPERFQEVKYVQISDDVAREITAGDLSRLPAGCIVVFGNSSRTDVPGHAAVTSGNGQMYADETDNSNWDNFVASKRTHNGKGEHGYVRVFRLNPAYYEFDPASNRVRPRS